MSTLFTSPANDVWLSLIRITQSISRAGGEQLRARGVSAAQFQLLAQVSAHVGIMQHELATELGVTKGNISQLIAKLVDDGLLQRNPQGAAIRLSLTTAGEALIAEMLPAYHAFIAARFVALTSDDLAQLQQLLSKIHQE
jgi:DNA-binding MarR family transcriptional regulator